MAVRVKHITKDNFAKFGSVVLAPSVSPTAEATEYKFWSDIAHYMIGGETEIGICTVYQQSQMELSVVERHKQTPEILIPIDAPFVLPLYDEGSGGLVEAFEVGIGEAVVIEKGVWHGACFPVGKKDSSYFVIFRRNTPHEDVEKKTIPSLLIEA